MAPPFNFSFLFKAYLLSQGSTHSNTQVANYNHNNIQKIIFK